MSKKIQMELTENQAEENVNEKGLEMEIATEMQNQDCEDGLTTENLSGEIAAKNEELSLEKKCEELNDKNLRLMAEFDNYRKRTLKEKSDLIRNAGENLLTEMLSLIDDFERGIAAMDTANDIDAVKEGVTLIYSKFVKFLTQNGVKEILAKDEDFNTEFHEAITTFPAASEEQKGKIIDCVTKGYTLNDKVIRFAKVVVGE